MVLKRISVIGCGRLGSAFALLAEQAGYGVIGVDKREGYVEELNAKTFRTPEPQIEYLLRRSKNFKATTNIKEAIEWSDLLFVFVPTPSKEDGEYDHQYVEEVVKDLIAYRGNISGKKLIICATVMPTYCKGLSERLAKYEVSVIYNPEFIAQGSIINDLQNADFVLMGHEIMFNTEDLIDLYKSIMKNYPEVISLTLTSAEITKIALNCYLTLKISYANLIGEIAIKSGEQHSVKDILRAIGKDKRIGNRYLNYGFGFDGICLIRDNKALGIHAEKVGVPPHIPYMTDEFNDLHFEFIKQQFIQANPDKNFPFIFNQLSYKKGVDIITDSQHYRLCKELLEEGYKVHIVESDAVIRLVQPELEKYGDRVKYGNGAGTASHNEARLIAGQKQKGYVISL